jgi:hypothetical protein
LLDHLHQRKLRLAVQVCKTFETGSVAVTHMERL